MEDTIAHENVLRDQIKAAKYAPHVEADYLRVIGMIFEEIRENIHSGFSLEEKKPRF